MEEHNVTAITSCLVVYNLNVFHQFNETLFYLNMLDELLTIDKMSNWETILVVSITYVGGNKVLLSLFLLRKMVN